MDEAYKLWEAFNLDNVYDHEQHVLVAERFDAVGKLPAIFQLLPPIRGTPTSGPTWRRCAR
jgi:hypothetical protein